MSKRDWHDRGALVALALILASVIVIAAIDGWSRYDARQPVGQSQANAPQQQTTDNEPQIVASERRFDPTEDTYAQWIMAAFAVAATFVSVWAVRLLGRTLDETRRAAEKTAEAVDTARIGNRISQEVGRAQVRAYMRCTRAEITIRPKVVECKIFFLNYGQSVALWCEAKAVLHMHLARAMTPPMENVDSAIAVNAEGDAFMVWLVGQFDAFGDGAYDRLRQPGTGFEVQCRLRWMDVFKDEHIDYFMFFEIVSEHESGPPDERVRHVELKARSMPATTEHLRKQSGQ